MVRVTAYALVVLGLIALGLYLREGPLTDDRDARGLGTGSSVARPAAAVRQDDTATSALPEAALSTRPLEYPGTDTARGPTSASRASLPESSHVSTLPSDEGNDETRVPGIDMDVHDPAAVIGRPFPLSAAVDLECKALISQQHEGSGCHDMYEALTQFVSEPRDEIWASKMERRIRDYFLMRESREWAIRAVECRTSICMVECTSGNQGLCHLEYEFRSSIGLLDHGGSLGHEINSLGATVVVSADAYTRREPL